MNLVKKIKSSFLDKNWTFKNGVCYLERTTNLEPKCSLSFLRAASTVSLSSKLAMASPDGLPSLLRITLTDKHFASGKKNSFISFSVALNGNPDIFRLNSLSNLQLLLEKVAAAVVESASECRDVDIAKDAMQLIAKNATSASI